MYILGILTTVVFDFIKEVQEKPYYYIETKTIEKITIVKVKIGNLGEKPLNFSEIISTPSIFLKSNLGLDIDSIFISNSNREELLSGLSLSIDKNNGININLKDEAFEKDDFIIVGLKHQGISLPNNWELKTRIIGHKNGISNYSNFFVKTNTKTVFFFLFGSVFFIIGFRVVFLKLNKKEVQFRSWELIFLTILTIIGVLYLYIYMSVIQYVI